MRTSVEFAPLPAGQLAPWRARHCQTLAKPQALLLELMAARCEAVAVLRKSEVLGYALVQAGTRLIEFHLASGAWLYADSIGQSLVDQRGITSAVVQSFDALMFASLAQAQRGVKVMGFLARDYSPLPLPDKLRPQMHIARAQAQDLTELLSVRQDVFADPERFASAVQAGEVWAYREAQGVLVGFGMLRRVRPEHEALEINLAVDEPYRRRAYAAYMLQDLVQRCVQQGMQPIASCPIHNQASRILGERIGLSSRDRLLEFAF